jgi:AP-4 complex subunit epsilon-1
MYNFHLIVYECVNAVTTIYPNATLIDAAATAISRFIRSDSHNLKYVGIKGLANIVKDHPSYATDHQLAVIDCLEDPDETLKRKTVSNSSIHMQ